MWYSNPSTAHIRAVWSLYQNQAYPSVHFCRRSGHYYRNIYTGGYQRQWCVRNAVNSTDWLTCLSIPFFFSAVADFAGNQSRCKVVNVVGWMWAFWVTLFGYVLSDLNDCLLRWFCQATNAFFVPWPYPRLMNALYHQVPKRRPRFSLVQVSTIF